MRSITGRRSFSPRRPGLERSVPIKCQGNHARLRERQLYRASTALLGKPRAAHRPCCSHAGTRPARLDAAPEGSNLSRLSERLDAFGGERLGAVDPIATPKRRRRPRPWLSASRHFPGSACRYRRATGLTCRSFSCKAKQWGKSRPVSLTSSPIRKPHSGDELRCGSE
jgi:hypothetical protein